jgi:hypothetical protein
MDAATVRTLLYLFQERTSNWSQRRLAVIADGGYLPLAETVERLGTLREALMAREIYPIFLVWETSWWSEFEHEVGVWLGRAGGQPGAAPADPQAGLALDRSVVGTLWSKLIERSGAACGLDAGGARLLAGAIACKRRQIPFDIHLASHGAGDLLLDGCLLGCMRVLAQDDLAEQADRTGPLAGSLLSLVAHRLASLKVEVADAPVAQAAEHAPRPEPILGLARDLLADPRLVSLGQDGRFEVTLLPGLTHLELPFDPEVQRLLVEGMLVPPPAPDQDLRDPLARALAALRSPQG